MIYDLLYFQKDNLIALSGTKGANVDMAHLPESLGDTFEERIQKYIAYRKTGVALFDSAQEGQQMNTIFNGYDDTVSLNGIQAIQLAINIIEDTASSITGVFKERLGGIQQRDAVANVEVGMQQSYIITKQYYQVMDTLVAEVLTDCLNLAKKVYKKGFTGQILLGNYKEIFTLPPEHYSFTDFDIHLADSAEIMKEQEQLKAMAAQLAGQNMIDPEILVIVSTSKSLTEMKDAVLKSVRAKKIENDQLAKLQQALQEAQQNQQQLQKQLEASTKKLQQLNERELAITEQNNTVRQSIDWYKVRSDAEYKDKQLELIKQRNVLEQAQLFDNNPNNDKIKNDLV